MVMVLKSKETFWFDNFLIYLVPCRSSSLALDHLGSSFFEHAFTHVSAKRGALKYLETQRQFDGWRNYLKCLRDFFKI